MSASAAALRETWQTRLSRLVIGQQDAIDAVVPFLDVYQAGLSPEGRPIGVVLLLGPTVTGKTLLCESVAEVLHGSSKKLLKIDCGEFQMDHETAKLIGSPPGYLGHRETQAILRQSSLEGITSGESRISVVLFDEIEKASDTLANLLLGILDKATLRLGDSTTVDFQNSLVFLTSNLGAKAIQKLGLPAFGFDANSDRNKDKREKRHKVALSAVRKKFSPEFVNRLDAVVSFEPLTREQCGEILNILLADFQRLISTRLGVKGFYLSYTPEAERRLLDQGVSVEYGARELKRTLQKNFAHPVAAWIAQERIPPQSTVTLDVQENDFVLLVKD
jgi:ATP-dependent Clp protease ATP-binding subunit ClpA